MRVCIMLLFLVSAAVSCADLKGEVIAVIDGKETTIIDGGTATVKGTPVTVRIAKTKVFTANRLTMRVPAQFSLETDDTEALYAEYCFDGNNVVFNLYVLKQGATNKEVVDLLLQSISTMHEGKKALPIKAAKPITIAGKRIDGREVILPILGLQQRHVVYPITENGVDLVLKFQYTDDKVDVDEFNDLVKALGGSITVAKAK